MITSKVSPRNVSERCSRQSKKNNYSFSNTSSECQRQYSAGSHFCQIPDTELQPREEETIVEMKRSKGARTALLVTGLALSVAGAVFLVYAVLKLYYLFF